MLSVDLSRRQGNTLISCAFQAAPAGITALFGPSGSGKTSVLNMVAGLTRPDRGTITLQGETLVDSERGICRPIEQRRIGMVFQDGRLFPHLSVEQNLRYGLRLCPVDQRQVDFAAVVEMLGIAPLLDRRPARLSGGEKQRVAIGRALLSSPRLLLMDEPLSALDSNRKDEVLPFIARLARDVRVPILYVTHSMDEILRLADWLVLMDQGASVAVGPVEDLLSRPDLRRLTGRYDPGAVLAAQVTAHSEAFALTTLATPAGPLVVPQLELSPGQGVRVRILARDVSLAAERPLGLSNQNIFRGTVSAVACDAGAYAEVSVLCGGCVVLSQVTRKAVHEMGLEVGRTVYALVKAVSIARDAIGSHDAPQVVG